MTAKFVTAGNVLSLVVLADARALHQSKVDLAMNVYDKTAPEDIRAGLRVARQKLLGRDLIPKDLLPRTPKPGERNENAA